MKVIFLIIILNTSLIISLAKASHKADIKASQFIK